MNPDDVRDKPDKRDNPLFHKPKRGEKRWQSDPKEHWFCQAVADAVAERFKDRKKKDGEDSL